MPPEGSSIYDSRKRAADTPEGAARKFVMWARAVGATGAYSVRTISALYWECAEVDHREPVAIDRFLRALKNARGVRQDASTADRRRRVWIIDPAEPKRMPKAPAAVAPRAAATPIVVARPTQLSQNVLQRFIPEQDYSSPQLLRATAHDARRQGQSPQAARISQRALGGLRLQDSLRSACGGHAIGDAPLGSGDDRGAQFCG